MWWLLPAGLVVGFFAGQRSGRKNAEAMALEAVAAKRAKSGSLVSAEERAQIARSTDPDAAIDALIDRKEAEARTILNLGPIRISE